MQGMFTCRMSRSFWYPGLARSVVIGEAALSVMRRHRQGFLSDESGGLLFATITSSAIHVVEATSPSGSDRRGSSYFEVDLRHAQAVINERFQHGLHYVGEWHTHPVDRPMPSTRDTSTMASAFAKSQHSLEALLMVIVGRRVNAHGLWVGLCNHRGVLQLCERGAEK